MKLPEPFVERGRRLASEMYWMGHRLDDLSRDELLAVAATMGNGYQATLQEQSRRDDVFAELLGIRKR